MAVRKQSKWVLRTRERPPAMGRLPQNRPLSRLRGDKPAGQAMARRLGRPCSRQNLSRPWRDIASAEAHGSSRTRGRRVADDFATLFVEGRLHGHVVALQGLEQFGGTSEVFLFAELLDGGADLVHLLRAEIAAAALQGVAA